MDSNLKTDTAIAAVYDASVTVVRKRTEDLRLGWVEMSIGDTVWFVKTGENILELQRGTVIGVKKYDRRMWENPKNGDHNKYTISTTVTLVIETSGGIVDIDSQLVYSDKQDALLASICNILGDYMKND
jgi:hypothetical protein